MIISCRLSLLSSRLPPFRAFSSNVPSSSIEAGSWKWAAGFGVLLLFANGFTVWQEVGAIQESKTRRLERERKEKEKEMRDKERKGEMTQNLIQIYIQKGMS